MISQPKERIGAALTQVLQPTQLLTQSQGAILQAAYRAKIAVVISGMVMEEIRTRTGNSSLSYHQELNEEKISGIAARISRSVIFNLSNSGFSLSGENDQENADEESDANLVEALHTDIKNEFDSWWLNRSKFVPAYQSDQEKRFTERYGPVNWKMIADSDREFHAVPPPGIHPKVWEVADSVRAVEGLFVKPVQREGFDRAVQREAFDRARTAEYGKITAENFYSLLPELEHSYDRHVIKAETLEKLKRNIPRNIQDFKTKTRRGVFVSPFRESYRGHPSVLQQLQQDITRGYEKDGHSYEGRYLMDEKGKILAWLTYWQPGYQPHSEYESIVTKYLENGATGGKMHYQGDPGLRQFKKYRNRILLFDTICKGDSVGPYASSRLFAHATGDMFEHDKTLKYIIAYRLRNLKIKPTFPVNLEAQPVGNNVSSQKFFEDRHFTDFASDTNKNVPTTERLLSDNSVRELYAQWVAFNGSFPEVLGASWKIWEKMQHSFGDVSDDNFTHEIKNHIEKYAIR